MCIELKKNIYNAKKVIKIMKFLSSSIDDNPDIQVIPLGQNSFVIQDGSLLVGTKQRVALPLVKSLIKGAPNVQYLTYSGTANGFGAVAVAYAAFRLGIRVRVFLNSSENVRIVERTRQICTLLALGAEVFLCDSYNEAKELKYRFVDSSPQGAVFMVPMGLLTPQMPILLSKQILKASHSYTSQLSSANIWLVAGTGGILQALVKAFPKAIFHVLLTGAGKYKKNAIQFVHSHKNVHIIRCDRGLEEEERNNITLYDSVKGYDDRIVPYFLKYADMNNINYIWNVGTD